MSLAPAAAPSQPKFDAPRFNTNTKSTTAGAITDRYQAEFAGWVNSAIGQNENIQGKGLDIFLEASSLLGGVDNPTNQAQAFKDMQATLRELDVQYNPALYAQTNFEGALNVVLGGGPVTLGNLQQINNDNLLNLVTSGIRVNGKDVESPNPDEVKRHALGLLAERHVIALGNIDSVSDAQLEAHLNGIVTKNIGLEMTIRNYFVQQREARINDIKVRLDKKEITWQEADTLANSMANGKLKNGVLELIKTDKQAEATKVASTAEAANLVGLNADEVADEIRNSPGFMNLPAEVREVLEQDIDIQKQLLEIDDKKVESNKVTAEANKRIKTAEVWKAKSAEWQKRLLMVGKGALFFGLLGALGGPAFASVLTGTITAASIGAGSVGLTTLMGGSIAFPIAYGLIGAGVGAGIGAIATGYDADIETARKSTLKAQESYDVLAIDIAKIERDHDFKKINDKVAFAGIYAKLFAGDNKFIAEDVQKAMLKALKLDNLKELNGMVAGAFK